MRRRTSKVCEWNRHVQFAMRHDRHLARSLHPQSFVISRTFCQLFIVCFLRRIVFGAACVLQNANNKLESHSIVHCHVILDANFKISCIILRIHETRPRRAHTYRVIVSQRGTTPSTTTMTTKTWRGRRREREDRIVENRNRHITSIHSPMYSRENAAFAFSSTLKWLLCFLSFCRIVVTLSFCRIFVLCIHFSHETVNASQTEWVVEVVQLPCHTASWAASKALLMFPFCSYKSANSCSPSRCQLKTFVW